MIRRAKDRADLRGKITIISLLKGKSRTEQKKHILDTVSADLQNCLLGDLISGTDFSPPLFVLLCIMNSDLMREYDIVPLDFIQKVYRDMKL